MKKKSTKKLNQIKIMTEKGTLYVGSFLELPLKEPVILQKSIFFYDDPDPCFIHRSAVRNRLLSELEHEFLQCASSMPETIFCKEQLPLFYDYIALDLEESIEIILT